MSTAIIPVAAKDDLLAIGGKHWERIESIAVSYLCKMTAVFIDRVKIKREASLVLIVGSKNDPSAIRKKRWCPIGLSKVCDLVSIAPVRVCNKHLHVQWSHQIFGKQFLVLLN